MEGWTLVWRGDSIQTIPQHKVDNQFLKNGKVVFGGGEGGY